MRWRGTILALVGSLLACVVCLQLLGTVIRQVDLLIPRGPLGRERSATLAARAAWESDWRIAYPVTQLQVLSLRNPTEAELARWATAENSFVAWAELLVRLRESSIDPAGPAGATQPSTPSSRPAPSEDIPRILADIEYAPPLRVALAAVHERFIAAGTYNRLSVRRAEAIFAHERYSPVLAAYRPVLRELSRRLRTLGEYYEATGRPTDAVQAYRVAVRGLTDVVKDSPFPEVALLAVAELEPVVAKLASLDPARSQSAAEALAAFRTRWIAVPDGEIGLLPAFIGPALVPAAHGAVLRSLTASVTLLAAGWVLAAVALLLILIVGVTRPWRRDPSRPGQPASPTLTWRWGGWAGAIVAVAIVVLPTLCVAACLASDSVPFIWLMSVRCLRAIILMPAVTLLLWALATRLCLVPRNVPPGALLPRWAVAAGVALVLLVVVAAFLVPVSAEAWRPPAPVQWFRRAGTLAGLASIAVLLVWTVLAFRARRRGEVPLGLWARGGLAVASAGMFVMLVVAGAALAVNLRRDLSHEVAFSRAIDEPIVARLGSDWWEKHFAPARSLAE